MAEITRRTDKDECKRSNDELLSSGFLPHQSFSLISSKCFSASKSSEIKTKLVSSSLSQSNDTGNTPPENISAHDNIKLFIPETLKNEAPSFSSNLFLPVLNNQSSDSPSGSLYASTPKHEPAASISAFLHASTLENVPAPSSLQFFPAPAMTNVPPLSSQESQSASTSNNKSSPSFSSSFTPAIENNCPFCWSSSLRETSLNTESELTLPESLSVQSQERTSSSTLVECLPVLVSADTSRSSPVGSNKPPLNLTPQSPYTPVTNVLQTQQSTLTSSDTLNSSYFSLKTLGKLSKRKQLAKQRAFGKFCYFFRPM